MFFFIALAGAFWYKPTYRSPMPFFHDIPLIPEDSILGIPAAFDADSRPFKVNLGVGTYKTAEGHSLVLNCVRKAESVLFHSHLNKDYSSIQGDPEFLKLVSRLLFGHEFSSLHSKEIWAAQTIGGTGALRIGAEFLSQFVSRTIFLSQPSWANHKPIFERAGLNVGSYPYFCARTCLLDFSGMCLAIENMPPSSIILLHGCCHNPTGIEPTFDQWKELSRRIKKRQLIPFFDLAYQGFGSDLEEDADPIRYFASEGHEMLVAYSFAKNLGLYGERVGSLLIFSPDQDAISKIGSQIKSLIRTNYSTPPINGARIVSTVLKARDLYLEWKAELKNMRDRIEEMRHALVASLRVNGVERDLSFMSKQRGLFSFMGISAEQALDLRQKKGIYLPPSGRLNIAALTTENIEYVAKSLAGV